MSVVATPPATLATAPHVSGSADLEPQPYRWTIAEYRELYKTGLFCDKKTMLLDGELYVMVMPYPPHDTALNLANEIMRERCPSGHHVRNQQGFDVGTRNDPGPDLALVPGSVRDYAKQTPTRALWVIEVSDSTLRIDTTRKVELYAAAQVPEYWVLDLVNRQLIVHRDPEPQPAGLGSAAYRTRQTYAADDVVTPLIAPDKPVKVVEMLP
jgi:Uma2 family endonuclease